MHTLTPSKKLFPVWLKLLLFVSLLMPSFSSSAVWAQPAAYFLPPTPIHPACVNDQGNAVVPKVNKVNAKALVLNFNHIPKNSSTNACVATVVSLYPTVDVDYVTVTCSIVNNLNGVSVGNGTAPFDGAFWIECPGGLLGGGEMSDFYVYGRATFLQTGPFWYPLVEHPDVHVAANVDANWHVTLQSTYGTSQPFSNTDGITNVAGMNVRLRSDVDGYAGVGTHRVNGVDLAPLGTVSPFSFDAAQPIIIGRIPGNVISRPWQLHLLIIDPPSPYSN
ncbi:MAG: hypothetical protein R3A44_14280 [Caldilineaceae bacterium]